MACSVRLLARPNAMRAAFAPRSLRCFFRTKMLFSRQQRQEASFGAAAAAPAGLTRHRQQAGSGGRQRQFGSTAAAAEQAQGFRGPTESKAASSYGMPLAPGSGRMILTDAMALLYRSHFAFSDAHRLRTASGEDTTVIFGFLNTLLNLLELSPAPTHFAVVFDAAGKNFRHELYSGYKGQRPEMPDAIRAAIPRLHEILDAMAVPQIQVPGVEADDVIGTMAVRGVMEGMAVAVASPDKDFMQLLRPGLILLRPPKKIKPAAPADGASQYGVWTAPDGSRVSKFALVPYTEGHFREEYPGLEPSQFIDLLALAGDSSDNVPGVAGIGPKTAAALLRQHGSLEAILASAPEGCKPKKAAEALASEAGAAAARLSRQLVEIRLDLDLPPLRQPLERLRLLRPGDGGAGAAEELRRLELRVHAERLQKLWASPAFSAR